MDPDLPLIETMQAGDDSALNELIHRHREPLFRFVYRYLRDEIAAADVVQETFVRAYFKAKQFRPRATVKTWLYTIALNLSRDQARRLSKRVGEVSLDVPSANGGLRPEFYDEQPTPGTIVGQQDQFARLQRAIDQLPQTLREALVLFSLDGNSQRETADILGTSPKTIELRVYHAKAKLRALLGSRFRPTD